MSLAFNDGLVWVDWFSGRISTFGWDSAELKHLRCHLHRFSWILPDSFWKLINGPRIRISAVATGFSGSSAAWQHSQSSVWLIDTPTHPHTHTLTHLHTRMGARTWLGTKPIETWEKCDKSRLHCDNWRHRYFYGEIEALLLLRSLHLKNVNGTNKHRRKKPSNKNEKWSGDWKSSLLYQRYSPNPRWLMVSGRWVTWQSRDSHVTVDLLVQTRWKMPIIIDNHRWSSMIVDYPRAEVNPHCNCSETALKLLWNCSETALKLLWNCTGNR